MATPLVLDAALRLAIIDAALAKLTQYYVFPEVAEAMEAAIRQRLERGEYNAVATGEDLRDLFTAHLREVSRDLHLRLVYHEKEQAPRENAYTDQAWLANYWAEAVLDNYGFYRAERLSGNVGYLDLRAIDEAEETAQTIAAALAFLGNTSALILDLRQNFGGAPSGVAFLCSYFFPAEPVHVNSIYSRPTDTTVQYWTAAYVPGRRYLDKQVFVLTSSRTFSGGEEIAYDLQVLKRATIVGEKTAGGANPVDAFQIHPHFDIRVPSHRAVNPITGTNWEGVGVIPDVEAPASEALRIAHLEALRGVIAQFENSVEAPLQRLVAEARQAQAVLLAEV